MATVTRADLTDAVHRETGLPRRDAAEFVDIAIEAIAERLTAGETVMISGFGTFRVRDKRARGPQPQDWGAGVDPGAPRRDVPAVSGPEVADRGGPG